MNSMFSGVTLSINNYENLLIGWAKLDLQENVTFDGGNSQYSSIEAENVRHKIIDDFNWTISDGGDRTT